MRLTPEDDAAAKGMVEVEGMSHRAVAKVLGCTNKTVAQAVERARVRARKKKPDLREKLLTMTPAKLKKLLAGLKLDRREEMILRLRIRADRPRTFRELADELRMTRQRAQQLEADLLGRLADALA